MSEKRPSSNRRQFFQDGFFSIVGPVADFLEKRWIGMSPPVRTLLRPPGAIPEPAFQDTCYRCGNCVEACPAAAIHPYPSEDEDLKNTPVIDPDVAACVVCDDLSCMKSCPSGALQLVPAAKEIRMGLALVAQETCVRSQGEDCTLCIEHCPLGESAMRLSTEGFVEVLNPGCVGCGVCQFQCPTRPKAIVINPL